jgi:hypothetical protein
MMLTCQRRLYDLGAVVWQDSSHEVLPTRIGFVSFWATMWGHALTWTMSLRRGLALTYVVTSERSLNKLSITTLTTTTAHVRVSALISEHWCCHAHGECCGQEGHEDPSRFPTHCANPPSGAECMPLAVLGRGHEVIPAETIPVLLTDAAQISPQPSGTHGAEEAEVLSAPAKGVRGPAYEVPVNRDIPNCRYFLRSITAGDAKRVLLSSLANRRRAIR